LRNEWRLDCRSNPVNAAVATLNASVRVSEHKRDVLSDGQRTANVDRIDAHNWPDAAETDPSAARSAIAARESDVVGMRTLNAKMLSSKS
jgi:hypothetical protein